MRLIHRSFNNAQLIFWKIYVSYFSRKNKQECQRQYEFQSGMRILTFSNVLGSHPSYLSIGCCYQRSRLS